MADNHYGQLVVAKQDQKEEARLKGKVRQADNSKKKIFCRNVGFPNARLKGKVKKGTIRKKKNILEKCGIPNCKVKRESQEADNYKNKILWRNVTILKLKCFGKCEILNCKKCISLTKEDKFPSTQIELT